MDDDDFGGFDDMMMDTMEGNGGDDSPGETRVENGKPNRVHLFRF